MPRPVKPQICAECSHINYTKVCQTCLKHTLKKATLDESQKIQLLTEKLRGLPSVAGVEIIYFSDLDKMEAQNG